ncbi:heterokaryon incompatibility protein-domain-containing protein [Phaeosphaeria sp. MPI-PUGE-AT-0046c]|nr:heterokaryon incompatibility protein-domain-containing protein [Phaeosphaeria sp. MPI-PUGE-AT-0046c]
MTPEDMESLPAYEHRPLDTTKRQIRLLKVTRWGNAIHCNILVTGLKSAPTFQALSYTWGSSTPTANISMAYKKFAVSRNLFTFLEEYTAITPAENASPQGSLSSSNSPATSHLGVLGGGKEVLALRSRIRTREHYSSNTPPKYIWIDQLCIDQSNPTERNHQVRLMSLIYRYAKTVIIWLGSVIGHPQNLVSLDLAQVADVLHNPYFTRLWIVQEVLLAYRIEIMARRTQRIDWLELSATAKSYDKELQVDFRVPRNVLLLFRERHKGNDLALGSCISSFCANGCVDLRDKVYGFMGLCVTSQDITVDYHKSTYEVYLDVLMAFRNAYLGRQQYPRPLLRRYPSRLQEYHDILIQLSEQMITSKGRREALLRMLYQIWQPDNPEKLNNHGRPDHLPIDAMGFRASEDACEKTSAHVTSSLPPNRWWYTCGNATYYFEC